MKKKNKSIEKYEKKNIKIYIEKKNWYTNNGCYNVCSGLAESLSERAVLFACMYTDDDVKCGYRAPQHNMRFVNESILKILTRQKPRENGTP